MKIDDCIHTFENLALKVLPAYFQRLDLSLPAPWPAELFFRPGFGAKALAKHLVMKAISVAVTCLLSHQDQYTWAYPEVFYHASGNT